MFFETRFEFVLMKNKNLKRVSKKHDLKKKHAKIRNIFCRSFTPVVLFLNQRPNQYLFTRCPALKDSAALVRVLEQIREGGTPVFNRYINTGGLAQFLSIFDEEICALTVDNLTRGGPSSINSGQTSTPKRHRKRKKSEGPFERKLSELYKKLETEGYGQGPTKMKIQLTRETFVKNAFDLLMTKSRKQIQEWVFLRAEICPWKIWWSYFW